jgi:hypothetical protein
MRRMLFLVVNRKYFDFRNFEKLNKILIITNLIKNNKLILENVSLISLQFTKIIFKVDFCFSKLIMKICQLTIIVMRIFDKLIIGIRTVFHSKSNLFNRKSPKIER